MKIYIVQLEYEGVIAAFTKLDKAKEYTDNYSSVEGLYIDEYNSITGVRTTYDIYNNGLTCLD